MFVANPLWIFVSREGEHVDFSIRKKNDGACLYCLLPTTPCDCIRPPHRQRHTPTTSTTCLPSSGTNDLVCLASRYHSFSAMSPRRTNCRVTTVYSTKKLATTCYLLPQKGSSLHLYVLRSTFTFPTTITTVATPISPIKPNLCALLGHDNIPSVHGRLLTERRKTPYSYGTNGMGAPIIAVG